MMSAPTARAAVVTPAHSAERAAVDQRHQGQAVAPPRSGCSATKVRLYSQSPSWDTASADKSRPNAGYLSAPRMVPADDIALCARSCVLAPLGPGGGAGVRRGTPACGGTPGSEKIVEDRASAEDPGNGGVPFFPLKPDLPR